MGVFNKLDDEITEVDIIIAGGGTAGCVVAGRLAEADAKLSILVIEGGADNHNVPNIVNPLLCYQHLAPNSTTTIFYKAKAAEQLAGRESIVASGGTLGGGSSINFMMYTRAQRADFDSWKMPSWSADEMLPYLKKIETYHGPGDAERHGFEGPIHISDGGYSVKSAEDDYIRVLESYGIPETKDMQSLDDINCCERSLRYVSKDGKRQDAAHTFLHPKLQDGRHPNLHVLVETKVVRVLFDENKKACGVQITPNPDFQLKTGLTKYPKQVVNARKLVVVSCGANGSPSVLERSGIGGKDVLERAGVPLVADLPGVGSNWQDHHVVFIPFKTSLGPRETIDGLVSGRMDPDQLMSKNDKFLGWNAVEVGVKLRPSEADIAKFDKDLLRAWERDFRDHVNRPLMLMGMINGFMGDQSVIAAGQYISLVNYTPYPYSRGSMHITGPEIHDPLDFDVGFLSDAGHVDLKNQVWAYKKHREFARRLDMYRGEVAIGHPKFPPGSKTAIIEDVADTGLDKESLGELEYSAEDDKAIEQYLRENIQSTWHSLGSAKMAPRDEMGVVDENLSVYVVQGLKVIDLSIPPENVAANTNNTALVIGEKGADIIITELGLSGN